MFVAPTEPSQFKPLGVCNSIPEEYGVDFLWQSRMGMVGVQRKQFPDDFLASVHDGRLNREYAMMQELDLAILCLEGKEHWTATGQLIRPRNGKRNGWSRSQHRNYLASVQMRGIQIAHTDSLNDTVAYLSDLQVWTDKTDHHGLDSRPGPTGNGWGRLTNRDYQLHVIQGLPQVGPKQAKAILDTLGFPFGLRVGIEELMSVPGIGKKRAERIVRVFGAPDAR